MKAIKKPVVVDVFHMTKERMYDADEWPEWLKFEAEEGRFVESFPLKKRFWCHTLEGLMLVSINDWIIKGVEGEIYPCKPSIFEQTYELEENKK